VGVHAVRWDKGGTVRAYDFIYIYIYIGKRNVNHQLGTGCFVHHRRVSTVKRVEFVILIKFIPLCGIIKSIINSI